MKRQNSFEMRAIAHTYVSSQECSVQESIDHCLPEL